MIWRRDDDLQNKEEETIDMVYTKNVQCLSQNIKQGSVKGRTK